MAGFDLSDVLAAARGIPGAREDGRWRCVVYLSAYDWMSGWLRVPDMAAQSAACKAWLAAHGDARKAETIRNRNAVRNVRAAFDELMRVIENRRADCVVVPDIAVFAPCFSEARFYVEEVLVPIVSVNVFFTVSANVPAPIPPTHIHRLRQRTFTTSG